MQVALVAYGQTKIEGILKVKWNTNLFTWNMGIRKQEIPLLEFRKMQCRQCQQCWVSTQHASAVGMIWVMDSIPWLLLPDPGVSGVRSMGPGLSIYLCTYGSFVKLCWCDSGWWWYQLNTIDDANLKRSLAIRNKCHICKSHTSWWSKQNCRNSGGKMKYNFDYQKYEDTKIRNTTSWVL